MTVRRGEFSAGNLAITPSPFYDIDTSAIDFSKKNRKKGQHRAFANTRVQIVMQRCLQLNNIIVLGQTMGGKKRRGRREGE